MADQDIKLLNANLQEEIEEVIEVVMMEIESAIIVENLDIWLKIADFLIKEKKVAVTEVVTEDALSKFLLKFQKLKNYLKF